MEKPSAIFTVRQHLDLKGWRQELPDEDFKKFIYNMYKQKWQRKMRLFWSCHWRGDKYWVLYVDYIFTNEFNTIGVGEWAGR